MIALTRQIMPGKNEENYKAAGDESSHVQFIGKGLPNLLPGILFSNFPRYYFPVVFPMNGQAPELFAPQRLPSLQYGRG
jgi:hypothetical protein